MNINKQVISKKISLSVRKKNCLKHSFSSYIYNVKSITMPALKYLSNILFL